MIHYSVLSVFFSQFYTKIDFLENFATEPFLLYTSSQNLSVSFKLSLPLEFIGWFAHLLNMESPFSYSYIYVLFQLYLYMLK
jgi:hypothetical protein